MPTRVLLLRHAESADPTIFHGAESDVGLSERGRHQAEAVAPYLARFAPTQIISSGMRRALDTAKPIALACDLNVHVEPLLHERRVGALSGTPTAGRDGVWPDTLRHWVAGDTGFAPSGAESFDAICSRLLPVWERLTTTYDGQTFVVIAHGVVIKVLLVSLLPGLTVADWPRLGPIHNVGVSELVCAENGWYAARLNELPPQVVAANEVRNPS